MVGSKFQTKQTWAFEIPENSLDGNYLFFYLNPVIHITLGSLFNTTNIIAIDIVIVNKENNLLQLNIFPPTHIKRTTLWSKRADSDDFIKGEGINKGE